MNKIFILLLFLVVSFNLQASKSLNNFNDIQESLTNGSTVNVVLDLRKCTDQNDPSKNGTMIGGITADSFLIKPDSMITFSNSHFTVNSHNKPTIQFLKYTLNSNNEVNFIIKNIELPSYIQNDKDISFKCSLNNGLKFLTK